MTKRFCTPWGGRMGASQPVSLSVRFGNRRAAAARTVRQLGIALLVGFAGITHAPAGEPAAEAGPFKIRPPEDKGYLRYPLRILDRSTHEAYGFDPARDDFATISYAVSKTGWVRVRMVHRDNRDILLRTLSDWSLSKFGRTYRAQWDGTDASGTPIDARDIFILFESKDRAKKRVHESHNEAYCRDPALTIVEPVQHDILGDRTEIIAVLADPPVGAANPTGYEARLHIDYRLAQTAAFPGDRRRFSFVVDPDDLSAGEHVFTINIDDLRDHVGAASIVLTTDRRGTDARRSNLAHDGSSGN